MKKESKKVEKVKKVSVNYAAPVSCDSLPDGCVYARDFAKRHGVPESSFRRHIASGIGGDVVEAEKSTKGRYLTPAQQTEALSFWDRHDVKYSLPLF